jgi:transcriptional regulator with XRE-family HTH domain
MVLLRHLLGDVLRRLRLRQGRTLREVSAAARVSLGYLSEVERGQKEASSELLAAICTALNTPLSHVLGEVSDSFALAELQNEAALTPAGATAQPAANGAGRELELPVARAFGVRPELRVPAGHARGMDAEPVLGPVNSNADHPAFDEVTRRLGDVSDMVPV